jgi:ligand-binding sensor domain-containing protein
MKTSFSGKIITTVFFVMLAILLSCKQETARKPKVSEEAAYRDIPFVQEYHDAEGVYALGPYGVWQYKNNEWEKKKYDIARSVRDAVSDSNEGLWVATDVGLYHCKDIQTELYQDENELISCYLQGISFNQDGELWVGGLGGVTVRKGTEKKQIITSKEGMPSAYVNSVSMSPDGTMWIGTDVGTVRYYEDGTHSLRFSKRWLVDDKVNDIAFDKEGNAWIATANGVSAIKRRTMTLAEKEKFYYDFLMRKHIREPWIAAGTRLVVPGDTATSVPNDDDNDGQYTSMYLAMESLRYAATNNKDAQEKARRAFDFLKYLQEVTETDGFFARTIVLLDGSLSESH